MMSRIPLGCTSTSNARWLRLRVENCVYIFVSGFELSSFQGRGKAQKRREKMRWVVCALVRPMAAVGGWDVAAIEVAMTTSSFLFSSLLFSLRSMREGKLRGVVKATSSRRLIFGWKQQRSTWGGEKQMQYNRRRRWNLVRNPRTHSPTHTTWKYLQ